MFFLIWTVIVWVQSDSFSSLISIRFPLSAVVLFSSVLLVSLHHLVVGQSIRLFTRIGLLSSSYLATYMDPGGNSLSHNLSVSLVPFLSLLGLECWWGVNLAHHQACQVHMICLERFFLLPSSCSPLLQLSSFPFSWFYWFSPSPFV